MDSHVILCVAQGTIKHGEVLSHQLHTALVLLSPITQRAVQNCAFPTIAEHTRSPNPTRLDYSGGITALHCRLNSTRFSLQTPVITIPSFSFNYETTLHSAIISIHSQPTKNDTTQQRESTPLLRPLYNSYNTPHTHQHSNRRRNRFLFIPCAVVGSFQTIITITQNQHNPSSSRAFTHTFIPTHSYPTQSLRLEETRPSSPKLAPQRKQRLPTHPS